MDATAGARRRVVIPLEGPATATMQVSSRASPGDIALLKTMFARFESVTDPWAFYIEAMERASEASDHLSGTGLARILAEGDMVLSLSVVLE